MSDLAELLTQTLQRLTRLASDAREAEGMSEPHQGRAQLATELTELTELTSALEARVRRLAESRDRFGAVLDSMREGVIALDEENRIQLANRSACKLFGWESAPLAEHIETCVDEDALLLFLREQLPWEAPWVELDFKGRRTVLARLTPLSNRGEAVLVLSDITALRRLETVRRDFVQNGSHELRTPTTVIRANAETLLSGAMDNPTVARGFLEGIDRNAQRLSHLVSDLLDLSRIESGTYQMQAEPVRPLEVIRRVVDTLADQIISKELKVKLLVDASLELSQDAGALEQVFTNLVENAVNYSHERGTITLSARLLPARHGKELIRFEVNDNGPGISEKHQARIFERFYRVDKGRSRHLGGTGLGLAIVKHLCHALGGEVGLESAEGQGCSFWFSVPRVLQ